jgi:hypothetical protein
MRIFAPGFGACAGAGYCVMRIDPAVVAISADAPKGSGAAASAGAETHEPSADDAQLAFG